MNSLENGRFDLIKNEEMASIHGGWKFWGTETVNGDVHSIVGNYAETATTTTTYRFGIAVSTTSGSTTDGWDER